MLANITMKHAHLKQIFVQSLNSATSIEGFLWCVHFYFFSPSAGLQSGFVAEWLACWTQAQKGPGFKSQSRRCRVTVLGKLFTPIVPLFTKQHNW